MYNPSVKTVILLPAFNEEVSIRPLFESFNNLFANSPSQYLLIICNDGSTDDTESEVNYWGDFFQLNVQLINHKINRGLGETIRDLFESSLDYVADNDVIVRMDCDNTHNPHIIPLMRTKIEEGYDVVIASRFAKGGGQIGLNFSRRFLSRAATYFMKLTFAIPGVKEYTCGFRAYRAQTIRTALHIFGNDFVQLKNLGFVCTLEKLLKLHLMGVKIVEVPLLLEYDKKLSSSKMIFSITVLGYFVMTLLFFWPRTGWKATMKKRGTGRK